MLVIFMAFILLLIVIQAINLGIKEYKREKLEKSVVLGNSKRDIPTPSNASLVVDIPPQTKHARAFQDHGVFVDIHSVLIELKEASPFKEADDILVSLTSGAIYSITGAGNFCLGTLEPRILLKARECAKKDLCIFNAEAMVYADSKGRLTWEY